MVRRKSVLLIFFFNSLFSLLCLSTWKARPRGLFRELTKQSKGVNCFIKRSALLTKCANSLLGTPHSNTTVLFTRPRLAVNCPAEVSSLPNNGLTCLSKQLLLIYYWVTNGWKSFLNPVVWPWVYCVCCMVSTFINKH